MRIRPALVLCSVVCAALGSCSAHWFSGVRYPDRSRPVVLIELQGKSPRLGATTSEGIVFLNEDQASGTCRVHYFLGPDLLVESGVVSKLGGVYDVANIDLKTQAVPVLTRELTEEDRLVALLLVGRSVERLEVYLSDDDLAVGDALRWPGRELPAGTGIFRERTGRNSGDLQFVGLARGLATLTTNGKERRYITFTGPTRMREALATPKPMFGKRLIKHRPDGISISK